MFKKYLLQSALSTLLCLMSFQAIAQLAGVKDNFALPTDPSNPSPDLSSHVFAVGNFDENTSNKNIGHRFTGLSNIKTAILKSKAKPIGSSANDNLSFEFVDATGINGAWSIRIGDTAALRSLLPLDWTSTNFPDGADIVVDLSALPQSDGTSLDLLPLIRANGFLDVRIQDDTSVDYFELTTTTFAPGCASSNISCSGLTNNTANLTFSCGSSWSISPAVPASTSCTSLIASLDSQLNSGLGSDGGFSTSGCSTSSSGSDNINISCPVDPLGNEFLTVDFDSDNTPAQALPGAYVNGLTLYDPSFSFPACHSQTECSLGAIEATAVGNATLSIDGNGSLTVKNIGSSGDDGVDLSINSISASKRKIIPNNNSIPNGAYFETNTYIMSASGERLFSTQKTEKQGNEYFRSESIDASFGEVTARTSILLDGVVVAEDVKILPAAENGCAGAAGPPETNACRTVCVASHICFNTGLYDATIGIFTSAQSAYHVVCSKYAAIPWDSPTPQRADDGKKCRGIFGRKLKSIAQPFGTDDGSIVMGNQTINRYDTVENLGGSFITKQTIRASNTGDLILRDITIEAGENVPIAGVIVWMLGFVVAVIGIGAITFQKNKM